jgi:hypothetical protein
LANERREEEDEAQADSGGQAVADGGRATADAEQAQADGAQADAEQECMPCGGRGTLISKLGGQESVLRCPWCEGSGQRRAGVDAQAGWLAERGEERGGEAEEDATRS